MATATSLEALRSTKGNVIINTTLGEFEIELYWHHAPKTCENVYELCRRGYYKNTLIHRISPNFVIQMGDPTGTGAGGESVGGGYIDDEISPELRHTGAGVVSMCGIDGRPNTNGSQFCVLMCPCPQLDGKHTIIGRVCRGFDVCVAMNSVAVSQNERPKNDIKILSTPVTLG